MDTFDPAANLISSVVLPLCPVPLNLNLIPLEDTTDVEYWFCVFVKLLMKFESLFSWDILDPDVINFFQFGILCCFTVGHS
jgi:hypothetical protein